ncbi:hypothetical protein BKA63DRAFT_485244 [Paraphoma chrysanthemicola]|nr:hypothetical protein BKA63DRAFT_485244 [Paraphoma chrysanthemicola]
MDTSLAVLERLVAVFHIVCVPHDILNYFDNLITELRAKAAAPHAQIDSEVNPHIRKATLCLCLTEEWMFAYQVLQAKADPSFAAKAKIRILPDDPPSEHDLWLVYCEYMVVQVNVFKKWTTFVNAYMYHRKGATAMDSLERSISADSAEHVQMLAILGLQKENYENSGNGHGNEGENGQGGGEGDGQHEGGEDAGGGEDSTGPKAPPTNSGLCNLSQSGY